MVGRAARRGTALAARAGRLEQIARLCPSGGAPVDALPVALAALALHDDDRHDRRDDATLATARALIPALAAACGLGADAARPARSLLAPTVAAVALRALAGPRGPRDRDAVRAVDAALVLMADHELNASTFATRVAASTGADLHACLAAGLAAACAGRAAAARPRGSPR